MSTLNMLYVIVYTGGSTEFVCGLILGIGIRDNILHRAWSKAYHITEEAIRGGNYNAKIADHCNPANLVR